MKKSIKVTAAAVLMIGASAFFGRAYADGIFALTGTVPEVTSADVIWANPNLALGALTSVAASVQNVVAAFQVYSNNADGFTMKAKGTVAGGKLTGGGTGVLVPYQVALFAAYADGMAGTPFLAAPGTGGTASAYTSPIIALSNIFVSGTLTAPVDTGSAAPYWLGTTMAQADVAALMADTYTDTLTITIVGN